MLPTKRGCHPAIALLGRHQRQPLSLGSSYQSSHIALQKATHQQHPTIDEATAVVRQVVEEVERERRRRRQMRALIRDDLVRRGLV